MEGSQARRLQIKTLKKVGWYNTRSGGVGNEEKVRNLN